MVKKIRKRIKRGPGRSQPATGSQPPLLLRQGSGQAALGKSPQLPSRYATEQLNRLISRIIEREDIDNVDDLNAFMQEKIANRPLDELLAEEELSLAEQAQNLAYQAMDSQDPGQMYELVEEALRLDRHCLDAQVVKARFTCKSDAAMIETLSRLIEQAEQRMGKEFLEENRGHFWGVTETRPYMRARDILNVFLLRAGRDQEAVKNSELMLELNPNDNQGIRDTLLGLYLKNSDLAGASRLLKQFDNDLAAVHFWGRVLERFLSGDLDGAKKAFRQAHKHNPHVADYLTGRKPVPQTPINYYSRGSEEEARVCLDELGAAWKAHPAAVEWLKTMKT